MISPHASLGHVLCSTDEPLLELLTDRLRACVPQLCGGRWRRGWRGWKQQRRRERQRRGASHDRRRRFRADERGCAQGAHPCLCLCAAAVCSQVVLEAPVQQRWGTVAMAVVSPTVCPAAFPCWLAGRGVCCRWWRSTPTCPAPMWRPCMRRCSPSAARVRRFTCSDAAAVRLPALTFSVAAVHPCCPPAAPSNELYRCTAAVYPDNLEYVDRVLQTCYSVSAGGGGGGAVGDTGRRPRTARDGRDAPLPLPLLQALERRGPIGDPKAERQVVALLSTPLDKYDAVTGAGGAGWDWAGDSRGSAGSRADCAGLNHAASMLLPGHVQCTVPLLIMVGSPPPPAPPPPPCSPAASVVDLSRSAWPGALPKPHGPAAAPH